MALEWYEFLGKLEWKGGIVGLLEWGGSDAFPVELQPAAKRVEEALQEIEDFIWSFNPQRKDDEGMYYL